MSINNNKRLHDADSLDNNIKAARITPPTCTICTADVLNAQEIGVQCDSAHVICTVCCMAILEHQISKFIQTAAPYNLHMPCQSSPIKCIQHLTHHSFICSTSTEIRMTYWKVYHHILAERQMMIPEEIKTINNFNVDPMVLPRVTLFTTNMQYQNWADRFVTVYFNDQFELHCPSCQSVYLDYEACDSLTCPQVSCQMSFCGVCLRLCGLDAHKHVMNFHGGFHSSTLSIQQRKRCIQADQLVQCLNQRLGGHPVLIAWVLARSAKQLIDAEISLPAFLTEQRLQWTRHQDQTLNEDTMLIAIGAALSSIACPRQRAQVFPLFLALPCDAGESRKANSYRLFMQLLQSVLQDTAVPRRTLILSLISALRQLCATILVVNTGLRLSQLFDQHQDFLALVQLVHVQFMKSLRREYDDLIHTPIENTFTAGDLVEALCLETELLQLGFRDSKAVGWWFYLPRDDLLHLGRTQYARPEVLTRAYTAAKLVVAS